MSHIAKTIASSFISFDVIESETQASSAAVDEGKPHTEKQL